jgi:mono/diheme cytochrome c family protein
VKILLLISALAALAAAGAAVSLAQDPEELFKQGGEVFAENCAQCHRTNGEGLPYKFPALHKNPIVLGDPGAVILTVLDGRRGKLGLMPAWKDKLSDKEIAAAVTYIRGAWSNRAPAVTPAMVAALRGK